MRSRFEIVGYRRGDYPRRQFEARTLTVVFA